MQDVNNLIHYYENLDSSDFPEVEPTFMTELKKRKAEFQQHYELLGLEHDVAEWLMSQNVGTKQAVNSFIKSLIQAQIAAKQNYITSN